MANIYFISDAHLLFDNTPHESQKRQKLLDFMDSLLKEGPHTQLYILGDLFDFWFEWYHVIPKYWFPILYKLKQLADSQISVTLITGNHDFYTGTFLEKEVGIHCYPESYHFEAEGKRIFAAHGDGYAREDWGYRILKKIIRHPLSIFLYKTFLPSDWGMQIARWTSHSSRKLVKFDKHRWSEEYYQYARSKFAEGFDIVVLGHIHFPTRKEENNKVYINCGDWLTHFTYARFDGKHFTLETWPSPQS